MIRLLLACCLCATALVGGEAGGGNLLLNPGFEFHAFTGYRSGVAETHTSRDVAFWETGAWGDITVTRASHAPDAVRGTVGAARNLVKLVPGKRLWQFATLSELGLAHGDRISLRVAAWQAAAGAVHARIRLMKLDSADGTWSPKEFGMRDQREFPRHARGELVVARTYEATSGAAGAGALAIDQAEIIGSFTPGTASHSADTNTIGLQIEFENTAAAGDAWIWSPCLNRGPVATAELPPGRAMTPVYASIPRTMAKLWKGEALHIVIMGSSIDRGSANPPMYLYDEDPASPRFKQPISKPDDLFDAGQVGRPELAGYFGQWRHYFSYGGRLKLELMRQFDLAPGKVLINFMACDGSCIGEAHSGLASWFALDQPPSEEVNGHRSGGTWPALYPELFTRPEGPRPDLVIFGSGANEKTDTPDEAAVFEGAIRWIQRHYPRTEFLFCQFQNAGSYTPNTSDLQALSLRYQIPYLDYDRIGDDVLRWCNRYALVPADGHPQAAAHYLWSRQLAKAFANWDPSVPGIAQRQLPERLRPNAYGWEGEMVTYEPPSGRLAGNRFVFDDVAVNVWGVAEKDITPEAWVDGVAAPKGALRAGDSRRNPRNSLFRHGNTTLGDRHILELGPGLTLTAVDAKQCPGRRRFGIEHPLWRRPATPLTGFASTCGAPFGAQSLALAPGEAAEIDLPATDLAVAWVDAAAGGDLRIAIDGREPVVVAANRPFAARDGSSLFLENRRGFRNLGYGLHRVRIEAARAAVGLLGIFAYDARPNRDDERRESGPAAAGETVLFTPPFRVRPWIVTQGGLQIAPDAIQPGQATFTGSGAGWFEAVGE